jgi:hypothetical protein
MFARESLQHFTAAEKDALLVILVGGTSNIIPFRRPFFFLIQLVVVLI